MTAELSKFRVALTKVPEEARGIWWSSLDILDIPADVAAKAELDSATTIWCRKVGMELIKVRFEKDTPVVGYFCIGQHPN
jgi:hypothetical protein